MKFFDRSEFEGDFKGGKANGRGKVKREDGVEIEGRFKNGKYIGK